MPIASALKLVCFPIKSIKTRKRLRAVDKAKVCDIAESISRVGLLFPITIDKEGNLLTGAYRLAAAKELDWERIDAVIRDVDERKARLMEIDENLCRVELSALERSQWLKEKKRLYEEEHPETKAGAAQGEGKKRAGELNDRSVAEISFTEKEAKEKGVSRRSVERDLEPAENLTPAAQTQIVGTKVADNKAELKRLSELPAKDQEKVARVIGKGDAKTVKEAAKKAHIKPPPAPKNGQQKKDPRIWAEVESLLGKALNRVDTVHEQFPHGNMHRQTLAAIKQAMGLLREWKAAAR